MAFTTLISPADLAARLDDSSLVICDCRFDLANADAGEAQFAAGHVPGARYVHLDRDLSGAKTGTNGRHPLPSLEQMAARFGALGIGPGTQVIAYDGDTGMYAARLWWMLRFMGHDAVAVLDGGFARWTREGHPVSTEVSQPTPQVFAAQPRTDWRLSADDVARGVEGVLVDARSPERFRGINETIDKVGGHIPGACNYFFQQNLNDDKTFKSPDALRAQWTALLEDTRPDDVVMYCGSGVTACHNLLAMEVAGLSGARIFPGSWSEWSSDPQRPVAT
ncbi:MAG: sulfurtransferase [Acidobacteria bacterium]|nr:sulfurtransferase [Acidobacteriota bacterium]